MRSGECRVSEALGEAEVGDARLVLVVNDDVGRLEVAVDDAVFVCVVNRLGGGFDVICGAGCGQRPVARHVGQRAARDIVHGEEVLALVFADFVDGNNVRVLEVRNGLSFGLETFEFRRPGKHAALKRGSDRRLVAAATPE